MQMTTKTWRILTIAYLVLYVVAIAIERLGLKRGPMSAMDMIFIAPFLWGLAVYGFQNGFVRGRFSRVERSESPLTFWINITVYFLIGLGFFCWGIRDAFR
jgi:hypothetical protein